MTVTTRDALAYPEVWLDGAGWVAFYPVPLPGSAAEQEVLTGVGAPPDQVELQDVTPDASGDDRDPELEEATLQRGLLGQVLLGVGAVVAALALWLVVVGVWTALALRRRRTVGDGRTRLLGAWRHVLLALEAAGVSRVPTLTAEEVVDRGRLAVAPEARGALASVAGAARRTLFSLQPVTEDDVTAAWDDAGAVVRSARRRRSRLSRLLDLAVPPRR